MFLEDYIGNTPLVTLQRLDPVGSPDLLLGFLLARNDREGFGLLSRANVEAVGAGNRESNPPARLGFHLLDLLGERLTFGHIRCSSG